MNASRTIRAPHIKLSVILGVQPLPFRGHFIKFNRSLPRRFVRGVATSTLGDNSGTLHHELHALTTLARASAARAYNKARSRCIFRLFTRTNRPYYRATTRLTRNDGLPFMVQRVPGTRQLVSRGRRQDHNIRRLVGTRRHDDAVTALRRTQRVMLPHLDRRTRATKGRKGSGVFQRRLRPLPDLKGRPRQVDRRLAIYNDNRHVFLRA